MMDIMKIYEGHDKIPNRYYILADDAVMLVRRLASDIDIWHVIDIAFVYGVYIGQKMERNKNRRIREARRKKSKAPGV